ncbi:MAG: hypothetical protein AAFY70_15855 [Bacteroidota bacterium]
MKESDLKKLLEEKQIPYSFFLSFMKGKTYSVVDGEAEYYQHDLDSFFLFWREYLAYISPPIL